MASRKPEGVTGAQLAELLNLESVRRVQQLVKEHGMPRLARGRYDAQACVLWYVRYLQQCVQRRGEPDGANKARDEKERLIRITADLKEIDKRKRLGELVTVDEFRSALTEVLLRVAAKLRNADARYAHRVVGLPDAASARRILRDVFLEVAADLRTVTIEGDGPAAPAAPAA